LLKLSLKSCAESPPFIQFQEILNGDFGWALLASEVLATHQWPVLLVECS
jgi:hypothetical protein